VGTGARVLLRRVIKQNLRPHAEGAARGNIGRVRKKIFFFRVGPDDESNRVRDGWRRKPRFKAKVTSYLS
jgi:hypothetical protein